MYHLHQALTFPAEAGTHFPSSEWYEADLIWANVSTLLAKGYYATVSRSGLIGLELNPRPQVVSPLVVYSRPTMLITASAKTERQYSNGFVFTAEAKLRKQYSNAVFCCFFLLRFFAHKAAKNTEAML
jgi:hypothetical protein